MTKKILISGGSGLIGSAIADQLLIQGHDVRILSRSKRTNSQYKYFQWDIDNNYIEEGALDVDWIIHLAGAGIADKRWSDQRKKQILDSRIKSTLLIKEKLKHYKGVKPSYIGASAIGIYGDIVDHPAAEQEVPDDDENFLVEVTKKWEEAHQTLSEVVEHFNIVRIGIVLSTKSGALKSILLPFLFRLGNYFGKGDQIMSWIHVDDLASIFIHLINKPESGIYNAVAPHPITGKFLINLIAEIKKGPFLKFGIPEFLLRLLFGEMSVTILSSTNVSAQKILSDGFDFRYSKPKEALIDLIGKDQT